MPVNQKDQHILAHATASDFSVTWQFPQREQLFFMFWVKLHALRSLFGKRDFLKLISTLSIF
jgi:hypothetical protein